MTQTGFRRYSNPRQLIYHWGSNPSVSWDWWIDPNSSTYLVREEFKHMDVMTSDCWMPWNTWETLWPLSYPAWSDHYEYCLAFGYYPETWQLLYKKAQERANRRVKKKAMKAARAQGLRKRDQMPGAWPV